ncbi:MULTISPECIES: NAD-dependent epimerase/dehydratase family protein [unclassified Rhizobium]
MTYRSEVLADDFHADTRSFFSGRKVLVLGGSGFVGSHAVEQLLALKAEPIVLSRSVEPAFLAHLGDAVTVVQGTLKDETITLDVTRRASVVLNLAASVAGIGWNSAHPASMFMNNMELFFSSLRAASQAGIERYLVTSSACVYPRHCSIPTPEGEGFADEPEPTNAGYGWAKRMEEFLGRAAMTEYGLSVSIARPYNCYGPRDNFEPATSHVIPALIRKAVEAANAGQDSFQVWGDGSHSRGFLYVDDFARGLIETAARYPEADAVNIGAAGEVTIRQTAESIAGHLSAKFGRPLQPRFDSSGITGQPRRSCDTSKSEAVLGYRAKVSMHDGLTRTIDWYISHAHNALRSHA